MALPLKQLTIAVVPGTGSMGTSLARNHAKAGLKVVIGSRTAEKAQEKAAQLSSETGFPITGMTNQEAAAAGDIVVWATSGSLEERNAMLKGLAPQLKDKIIIDVTNVLYLLDESSWGQTSAPLLNQAALGVPARWTTAWKATFQGLLDNPPDPKNPHNTFVCGDDEEAVATTIALVDTTPGFKGLKAGGLKHSKIVELLGPMWVVDLVKLNDEGFRAGWRFGK